MIEGPNCWNEATFVAGLLKEVRHTPSVEFAEIIESSLCKEVPFEKAELGDIVALRRFDRHGNLLPHPQFSEIHGYTYLNQTMGFTKNGTMAEAPYQEMSHQDIFQFYKKSEYTACKQVGLDRPDCNMKAVVFRCQGDNRR